MRMSDHFSLRTAFVVGSMSLGLASVAVGQTTDAARSHKPRAPRSAGAVRPVQYATVAPAKAAATAEADADSDEFVMPLVVGGEDVRSAEFVMPHVVGGNVVRPAAEALPAPLPLSAPARVAALRSVPVSATMPAAPSAAGPVMSPPMNAPMPAPAYHPSINAPPEYAPSVYAAFGQNMPAYSPSALTPPAYSSRSLTPAPIPYSVPEPVGPYAASLPPQPGLYRPPEKPWAWKMSLFDRYRAMRKETYYASSPPYQVPNFGYFPTTWRTLSDDAVMLPPIAPHHVLQVPPESQAVEAVEVLPPPSVP